MASDNAHVQQSEKLFIFTDKYSGKRLEIRVPEIVDAAYGLYTWPSAPVLAQYLWFHRDTISRKSILELSAGTSLPGIVAAKCGATVHLSDNSDYPKCLEKARQSCRANGLDNVPVYGIKWGSFSGDILTLPKFDMIISSDCFYDSGDFEDIVATVAFLLEQNKGAEFLFTYQIRSASKSIESLLYKWELKASMISLSTFNGWAVQQNGTARHTIQMFRVTSI